MARRNEKTQQYRAAYPRDPEPPTIYPARTADEEYTDDAYGEEEAPVLFPYGVSRQQPSIWAWKGIDRRPKNTALWTFVALCCITLLALMGYGVAMMYQPYPAFRQRVAITQQGTFAQGVLVDNIHIGGMTREQATAALSRQSQDVNSMLRLIVQVNQDSWLITGNDIPFQQNIQSVLDTAYAIGRQGTAETISSSQTPFDYRYAHLHHTATAPAYLYTQVTYDKQQVRNVVDFIAYQVNREPVDAQLYSFDFASRSFSFTAEQAGLRVDEEKLYQQLIGALDRHEYNAVIRAEAEILTPQVTRVEMMNSFSLISSFTTQTTSDANRNTNIRLACDALMGRVLEPGETFSFNQATGQRTTEKGYLPAAAIAAGATFDDVAGGVCQVSSTLYNAAVMADLTILNRVPHAWPSTYVDKGLDATVNWPNLDFTFRNDKESQVFIVAYYQNRKCTVEIYGKSLGPGESIKLSSRVISTTQPPAQPEYRNNPLLPRGTTEEKVKARTGYLVESYKIYLRNGVEYRRELLDTSNYRPYQQVIEWN